MVYPNSLCQDAQYLRIDYGVKFLILRMKREEEKLFRLGLAPVWPWKTKWLSKCWFLVQEVVYGIHIQEVFYFSVVAVLMTTPSSSLCGIVESNASLARIAFSLKNIKQNLHSAFRYIYIPIYRLMAQMWQRCYNFSYSRKEGWPIWT